MQSLPRAACGGNKSKSSPPSPSAEWKSFFRIVSPGIHKLLRLAEVGHWKIMSWMGLAYQFNSLWTKRLDSAHMNSLRIEIILQLNILGGISPYISPYIWYSYLHFRILKFPLINKTDPLDSPISKSWSCILHPRTVSTVNPAACCYALNGSSSHHIIPYHITSDHFISRQLTAYHITIITSSRAFH